MNESERSLLGRIGLGIGADAAVAGTTAIESTIIDTQGLAGVAFVARIATANAGNFLEVSESVAADMAGGAALVGAKAVAVANNDLVAVDVKAPQGRYLQATITRGVSSATGDMLVLRYTAHWQVSQMFAALGVSPGAVAE